VVQNGTFGTKNSGHQNWLPQHQQLTKNKWYARIARTILICRKSSLITHHASLSKIQLAPQKSNPVQPSPTCIFQTPNSGDQLRTRTNAQERPRTPNSPRAESISHSHRSKPPPSPSKKPQIAAIQCNLVQLTANHPILGAARQVRGKALLRPSDAYGRVRSPTDGNEIFNNPDSVGFSLSAQRGEGRGEGEMVRKIPAPHRHIIGLSR
jgi:hypothetical protein